MATQKRRSQCDWGKPCRALSLSQTAQPPGTLRAAEPLPRRAKADSSAVVRCWPAAAPAPTAQAANPPAPPATPPPGGKTLPPPPPPPPPSPPPPRPPPP